MNSSRPARLFLVCLIAATLVGPAWESPKGRDASANGLLNRFWSALTAIWAEAGCGIDPNGSCGGN